MICFEEGLWMLTSKFLFSFALCILLYVIKEQRGGRSREHKILYNFANDCAWFLGKEVFFP